MMKRVAEGMWEVREDLRMPGGIYFNSRMSVVDVGNGELLLYSPVAIDAGTRAEIAECGEVRWIVAPNDLHHTRLSDAARSFPDAEVWATSAVQSRYSGIEFAGALDEGTPKEWRSRIESVFIDGTRGWAETVLLLPDRRTVVCADLVFNIHETVNARTRWLLKMVGAFGRCAQSASVRFWFTRDRVAVTEAFERILAWDFDRVVVGHGRVVETDGREVLRDAFSWAVAPEVRALTAGG